MTGEELYFKISERGWKAGFNTKIREYAQTLGTAFFIVGPDELYRALEEAQRTKKKIELVSISDQPGCEDFPCEPHGIRLVEKGGKNK